MEFTKRIRVGSYGLIIKDKKIALIEKARGGYKGLLDLPGGGIKHGESPNDALIRELKEEVGATVKGYELLTVSSKRLKWHDDEIGEDLHQIGILYNVVLDDYSLKSDGDGHDSNGCNFYDIDKLKRSELTPFVVEGLDALGYKLSK